MVGLLVMVVVKMENNKAGIPVTNASYWRRRYLDLTKKTDILCDIILNEYPPEDDRYIIALDIQRKLEIQYDHS